jgi:hypothetical protein
MEALVWSTGLGSVDQDARDKKFNYRESMNMKLEQLNWLENSSGAAVELVGYI